MSPQNLSAEEAWGKAERLLAGWLKDEGAASLEITIDGIGLAQNVTTWFRFDSESRSMRLPREPGFAVAHLRRAQALPGWGAWTWAHLWMTADEGVLHGEYDWMREPIFSDPTGDGRPLSGDCARELKNYPRDPENIPEWMAAGAAAFEKREARNARRRERYRERKEQKAREVEAQNDHADTAGSSVEK